MDPIVCPIILPKISSNEGNEKPQSINGSRELDMEQTTKFMAKKLNQNGDNRGQKNRKRNFLNAPYHVARKPNSFLSIIQNSILDQIEIHSMRPDFCHRFAKLLGFLTE